MDWFLYDNGLVMKELIQQKDLCLISATGRIQLGNMFKLCKPLLTFNDVYLLNDWLSEVWVNLAMGKLKFLF